MYCRADHEYGSASPAPHLNFYRFGPLRFAARGGSMPDHPGPARRFGLTQSRLRLFGCFCARMRTPRAAYMLFLLVPGDGFRLMRAALVDLMRPPLRCRQHGEARRADHSRCMAVAIWADRWLATASHRAQLAELDAAMAAAKLIDWHRALRNSQIKNQNKNERIKNAGRSTLPS